jgi:cellulose synthase/poly-beta-1,6-N-acetylglucosamine synthase-like glycosyltransferase
LVTIQLPIYNEKYVVERLLTSIAALEYPREKLEIQVLDDSTDDSVIDTCQFNFEISKHWIGYQTHYPKQQTWF